MLPILLLAGLLGFVGYKLGGSHDRKLKPISFGAVPGAMAGARQGQGALPGPARPPTPYLDFMVRIVTAGQVPNQNLADAAYAEAQAIGDFATMQTIEQLVIQWTQAAIVAQQKAAAPQEQVVAGANDGDETGEYEMANPQQKQEQVQAANGLALATGSPIDGVTDDEWCELVRALKTKDPAFQSENYLGAFEHNRRRLKQLGLDEARVATADGQYEALCTDIQAYLKSCPKLIEDYCGDVVDLDGNLLPVTMSGVLGLLKTAGPRGAESWLRNPEDRKAFPQTTAAFVRCNGHF